MAVGINIASLAHVMDYIKEFVFIRWGLLSSRQWITQYGHDLEAPSFSRFPSGIMCI